GLVVRRRVRQLVRPAVGLVRLGDAAVVLGGVRGGAVVEGPATTGEVELVGDHVLPEADDGGTEVLVPGLQGVVGHPGEQVVGAHCVPAGDRLVLHRVDVLVVVPAGKALPAVQVQQPAGQGEVPLVPG